MQDDDSKERRCVKQRTDLVSLRGRCQIVGAVFGGTMTQPILLPTSTSTSSRTNTRWVFVGLDPMLIVYSEKLVVYWFMIWLPSNPFRMRSIIVGTLPVKYLDIGGQASVIQKLKEAIE